MVILPVMGHKIYLFNKEQHFEDRWKFEVVLTHFKNSNSHNLDNYRTICNIIELGKLVELAVWDQMMHLSIQKRNIHPNHLGFPPWHITAIVLAQVHDILTASLEQKRMSAVILHHQSAAFDIVDYSTLTSKMRILNFSTDRVNC